MSIRSFQRGSLQGARIGRDVSFFDKATTGSGIPGDERRSVLRTRARDGKLGATVVDTVPGTCSHTDDEFTRCSMNSEAQIATISERSRLQTGTRLTDCFQQRALVSRNWFNTVRNLRILSSSQVIPMTRTTSSARTHARNTARLTELISTHWFRISTRLRAAPDEIDGPPVRVIEPVARRLP